MSLHQISFKGLFLLFFFITKVVKIVDNIKKKCKGNESTHSFTPCDTLISLYIILVFFFALHT